MAQLGLYQVSEVALIWHCRHTTSRVMQQVAIAQRGNGVLNQIHLGFIELQCQLANPGRFTNRMHHQPTGCIVTDVNSNSIMADKPLLCYCRCLSGLSFSIVLFIAVLCFLSKLITCPLTSSQFALDSCGFSWKPKSEPVFIFGQNDLNASKCSCWWKKGRWGDSSDLPKTCLMVAMLNFPRY